jgi:hypothetical protein
MRHLIKIEFLYMEGLHDYFFQGRDMRGWWLKFTFASFEDPFYGSP